MEVVKLLESKNRCLQKLVDLTIQFLAAEDFEQLESFISRRESILKALDLYDRKVTEVISALPLSERTPELIERVRATLADKDRLVQTIILKDNELTAKIEERKKSIHTEITASRKNRDAVGKFKSTWVSESGEGFDQKL